MNDARMRLLTVTVWLEAARLVNSLIDIPGECCVRSFSVKET
jgi:hypothetical protein